MGNFRSSPTEGGADKMPVLEMGQIVSVDIDNWLFDVICEFSGRVYKEIQLLSPYFHSNNGEGFYAMPEVGAQCIVASMSDDNPPVILAFSAVIEEMFVAEDVDPDTAKELKDAGYEVPGEMADEEDKPAFSYRNGRPLLRPGDQAWRTRDGNFIFLRRGGVVQIGSTAMCQSIFIPVENLIRTFAQNYELDLVGGKAAWEVVQEEDGSSTCVNTFTWREYAEQANVSAVMSIGDLDENFFRFYMVINGINPKTLEYETTPPIEITFSKEGDIAFVCKSYTKTVEEDQTIEVGGTETEHYGELDREVDGQQKLKFKTESRQGESSEEKLKSKIIEADSVVLGGSGGSQPVVLGNSLVAWLAGHKHIMLGAAVGPPDPGDIANLINILSKIVKAK